MCVCVSVNCQFAARFFVWLHCAGLASHRAHFPHHSVWRPSSEDGERKTGEKESEGERDSGCWRRDSLLWKQDWNKAFGKKRKPLKKEWAHLRKREEKQWEVDRRYFSCSVLKLFVVSGLFSVQMIDSSCNLYGLAVLQRKQNVNFTALFIVRYTHSRTPQIHRLIPAHNSCPVRKHTHTHTYKLYFSYKFPDLNPHQPGGRGVCAFTNAVKASAAAD